MKYDLHVHTTCSDGKYSKLELLKYFNDNAFQYVAFADHNYIELKSDIEINSQYFNKYDEEQLVSMISAIEFDVLENRFLHILGYDIKDKERIYRLMEYSKKTNTEITKKIIENIKKTYDIEINIEELKGNSPDGNISKRDITKWIFKNGYAKDYIEAGLLFTSKESPCYEKKYSPTIDEVLSIIYECGGYSIMAHPFSLKLDENETKKYIYKLVEKGLMGIEINNLDKTTSNQVEFLKKIANDLSLLKTSGSDFHNGTTTQKIGLDNADSDEFIRVLRR